MARWRWCWYLLLGIVLDLITAAAPVTASDIRHPPSLYNRLNCALDVILVSKRYKLLDSVWFDAINGNGTDHIPLITVSAPNSFTELVAKATRVFDTHYLIWKIGPGINVKVFKMDNKRFGMSVLKDVLPVKEDKRTFGIGKRRIMMALLPIMYKLGVITTLLIALTVITLKGLTVGVILLMLSFGGLVSKLKHHTHTHQDHWPQKDVHIHVHPFPSKSEHYVSGDYSWHRNGDVTSPPWTYLPSSITSTR